MSIIIFLGKVVTCTSLFSNNFFYYFPCLFYVNFKKNFFLNFYTWSFFKNFSYSLCFRFIDFCKPLVIRGECKCRVLISVSLFGNAVSCKSEKINCKFSYALSGELLGTILFDFIFSSSNSKTSMFSLDISRLVHFVFF